MAKIDLTNNNGQRVSVMRNNGKASLNFGKDSIVLLDEQIKELIERLEKKGFIEKPKKREERKEPVIEPISWTVLESADKLKGIKTSKITLKYDNQILSIPKNCPSISDMQMVKSIIQRNNLTYYPNIPIYCHIGE